MLQKGYELPQPKGLLKILTEGKVEIEDEHLKRLLEHPKVFQRKIVIFSIIGAYRKGKSFFMNYCLRYLYANFSSIRRPNRNALSSYMWMGDRNEPLKGFSWRDGLYRDTTGIVIWNDVFLHTNEDKEKLAIIVMDTHGLFDNETTPMNNSRIFALGTLLSSVQVFNIANVIQEDQLQYLQYAIEFANFSFHNNEANKEKIFQRLIFLLRDWTNEDDYPFGIEGGEKYLKYILESNPDGEDKLRSACEDISNSFEILSCSLLPNPGDRVRIQRKNEKAYNGNWDKMDPTFSSELFKLIEELLKPENLKVKKVEGKELYGFEYLEYAEKCLYEFSSDKLPKTPSTYRAAVDTHMKKLVDLYFNEYRLGFDAAAQSDREKVADIHSKLMSQALKKYENSKLMGDAKDAALYLSKLEQKIIENYKSWCIRMEDNKKKIEIVTDNMQKKLEKEHQAQIKIKNEMKQEMEEKIETERKKRREYEIERIKKYKQIPSLLIDRKVEDVIQLPLDSINDITDGQLKTLLEDPSVRSCKIAVISIVGGLKSKSNFILNYCLRYLYAHHTSLSYSESPVLDSNNWKSKIGDQLEEIAIKPKMKLDNSGIVFWNDVFFYESSYEKIAIILLDTHAIYASDVPSLDVLRILELGTLLSSVQIFQLDFINQAIDLAVLCNENKHESKPFQSIGLLVNKSATSYSFCSSIDILKRHLTKFVQSDQVELCITSLDESFHSVKCHELYLPAKTLSEDSSNINEEFKDLLFSVIETLLKPDRLKTKINNGKELNGTEYFEYVEKCLLKYQSHSLLVNPSNFNAVVERFITNSVNNCFEFYKENILSDVENHDAILEKAYKKYDLTHKMGTPAQKKRFKEILTNQIDDYYRNHVQSIKSYLTEIKILKNDLKNNDQKFIPIVKEKDRQIDQIIKEHKDKLEVKDKEIKQLKRDYASLTDQMREVQANNSTLLDTNKKLTEEVKESNSKYFDGKSKWHKEKLDLEKRNAMDIEKFIENSNILNSEMQKLIQERNSIARQFSREKANLESVKTQNIDLQSKIDSTRSFKLKEISRLTEDLKQAKDEIYFQKHEITTLKKQLDNGNSKINDLEYMINNLRKDLQRNKEQSEELERSKHSLQKIFDELKSKLETGSDQNVDLPEESNDWNDSLQQKNDDLRKKLQDAENKIQTLKGQLESEKFSMQIQIDRLQAKEEPTTSQQANILREQNENQIIINERVGKFDGIVKSIGIKKFLELLKKRMFLKDKDMMSIATVYITPNVCYNYYNMYAYFKDEKVLKSIFSIGTKLKGESYNFMLNTHSIFFVQPKYSMEKIQDTICNEMMKNCFQFKTQKQFSILDCLNIIEDIDNDKVECISTTEKATYIAFFDEQTAQKYFQQFELNELKPFRTTTYLTLGKTLEIQSYKKNNKSFFPYNYLK